MPGWGPFTALSVFVLFVLLALARLSQGAVREDQPALPAEESTTTTTGFAGSAQQADSAPASSGRRVIPEFDDPPDRPGTPHQDIELTTGALLANVAFTQGLFGAIIAAGAWYWEIPGRALGLAEGVWQTGLGGLAVGLGFGLVLWLANEMSATLADAVGATYDENLREMLTPETPGGWVVLLGVILPIIAIVEELLFRAALIGVPAAGFDISPWALAILSSTAFALGHGAQGKVGVAVTGGLGLALAAGYIVSGSLVVVVVAHYLVNALEFVVHEGLGFERLLG